MRRMLPAMSRRYFHNNLFARFLCYCDFIWLEEFVFDKTSSSYCCRFFASRILEILMKLPIYAKAIYTGQDTCCMYQRGKRGIVKNMATFSDDLVFAISIQFATFRGVQCSCLYNLLCVHTCHLSRNKGEKSARTFLVK